MIYNQKQAIFVVLAGLFTSAKAAPAHRTKNGHTSELIAPGEKTPVNLAGRIDKDKYTPACHEAWQMFSGARCWCKTGCALDCSEGRSPGTPGKDLHPDWCKESDLPDIDCEVLACDLVSNCEDAPKDLAPGLDKVLDTAGYTCGDVKGHLALDFGSCYGNICIVYGANTSLSAVTEGDTINVIVGDGVVDTFRATTPYSYSHASSEGGEGYMVCGDLTSRNADAINAALPAGSEWSDMCFFFGEDPTYKHLVEDSLVKFSIA